MKKLTVFIAGVVTGLALIGVASAAKGKKEAVLWSAEEIKWAEPAPPPGVKMPEGMKLPMVANLWGDPLKSAHGALAKFEAGTEHPLHVHTPDTKGVVISGTFWIAPEGAEKKKLGAGSYFEIPAGWKHTSGCEVACVIFQTAAGKFDTKMVGEPKVAAAPVAPAPKAAPAAPAPKAAPPAPVK